MVTRLFGPPKRGWARDARLWVVAALLAYVLLGFFAVPWAVRYELPKLTRKFLGREATLRAAQFNPFTLTASLRGFDLRDRDGTPLAAFDELTVDFELSSLFRRAWTFREVRLVHPTIVGRIMADGRPAVADLFESKPGEEKPKKESPIPRLLISDLEIGSGTIEFQDLSKSPPFTTKFQPLSVSVARLTTIPDRSGGHSFTVGIEDRGEAKWSGRMSMQPLRLEGELDVSLTRVTRIWEYLGRTYPIQLASGAAHVAVPYVLEKTASGDLRFEAHDVAVDISGVTARPRDADADWVELGRVDLKGGRVRWPEHTADVQLVRISEPAVKAWLAPDGKLNWLTLVDQFRALPSSGGPSGGSESGPPSPAWKATCAAVEIAGGGIDYEDRTTDPPAKLAVTALESRVEDFRSDASTPLKARVSAKLNGTGTVTSSGTIGMKPASVDLDVELAGFETGAFQPFASQIVRVQLQSGAASVGGRLAYHDGGKPVFKFDGRATLDRLAVADPDGIRILSWDALAIEDIRLALQPNQLRVKTIAFKKPYGQILIDRQGVVGVQKLRLSEASSRPQAAAVAAPPPPGQARSPFPFEIGSIQVHDAMVDYGDESLILPFKTQIRSGEGALTDLSSKGSAGSRLAFEGKVDEHGYAKAEGALRIFDPYAESEIRVLFRNVDMDRLTPYTAEFAGYSIKEGRLDVDVDYKIKNRALVGNHKVAATSLTLGDKVPGAKSNLPLRLAVALLKDSEGKIELEVPIEGSVDDPEFGYKKVILQAFKRVLINITTAPFHFLGRLLGIKGEDLESVSFEPGRSELLPPEKEKLGKLVGVLKDKPDVVLQIGGRFDPDADAAALRRDKLDAKIAARREAMSASAGEEGEAVLDRIMESLYDEAFSADARVALKRKHTSAEATSPAEPPKKRSGKQPPAPPPGFDAAGYFEEIRQQLLKAQPVGPDELDALARARSAAIGAELAGGGGLDAARVKATDVEAVKKKAGQDLIPCRLAMTAD